MLDFLLVLFVTFRFTVIPGPPLFFLTVQLLDLFPCRVEFIKDIQQIPSYGQRLCFDDIIIAFENYKKTNKPGFIYDLHTVFYK